MRRPRKQSAVINEIEPLAIGAVDEMREVGAAQIKKLWGQAKSNMRLLILHEYHRDFPGTDRWSLGVARAKGTLLRIERHISQMVNQFHEDSLTVAASSFRRVYNTAALRHAWVLDQVTPPSYTVKVPLKHSMQESAVAVYTGREAATVWKDRWSTWLGAYQSALNNNIRMGALNESSGDEAADEVDDTKAGTPSYDIDDALSRIYNYQAFRAYSDALHDLSDQNPAMGIREVWQTRYNARVCDECEANRGLTSEEADNDIPAHPNCECYWRLVPAPWSELLKSGNMEDRALAERLDAEGAVPNSMILKNENDDLMAHVIVGFDRWAAGMGRVVGTGGIQ